MKVKDELLVCNICNIEEIQAIDPVDLEDLPEEEEVLWVCDPCHNAVMALYGDES